MKVLNLFLAAALFACATASFAAQSKQVSVVVKKVNEFSESGDGYTFTTTDGKEYYVYNAGGASPRKGEMHIKKGAALCLKLNSPDGMGDIDSITKGKCKK